MNFFIFFPRKIGFDKLCNLSPASIGDNCMKRQMLMRKNQKIISSVCRLLSLPIAWLVFKTGEV